MMQTASPAVAKRGRKRQVQVVGEPTMDANTKAKRTKTTTKKKYCNGMLVLRLILTTSITESTY